MMYEKLVRGEMVGPEEETFMVDFFAKKHRRQRRERRGGPAGEEDSEDSSSGSRSGSGSGSGSDSDGSQGGHIRAAEKWREKKRRLWEKELRKMEQDGVIFPRHGSRRWVLYLFIFLGGGRDCFFSWQCVENCSVLELS
mgnify:CR=1 FL=1